MPSVNRPPPHVLFVHNGLPYEPHLQHLTDAGLTASEAHTDAAVAKATALQPDIIVLDFDCDGDVTEHLKTDSATKHIPVIALVALMRPE